MKNKGESDIWYIWGTEDVKYAGNIEVQKPNTPIISNNEDYEKFISLFLYMDDFTILVEKMNIWKEVEGFSRIGVYVGNNSTSDSFIYCGFRPAFVMWRKVNSGENWRIIDSARSPDNQKTYQMFPGQQHQESDEGGMDFHFNGFALRSNDGNTNDPTAYVFMAFAESPLK